MKRKLLFAALCAVGALGGQLRAQGTWTDKTSVITNPSFETGTVQSDLTTCGWATDRVPNWTISPSSPSNSQVGIGNSSSKIQGIASTFSPSVGSNYFYMRENWNPNTTFSISQTIPDGNIPAGIYRLTVKAAMFSSYASTYTLSLQEEGQTAATNSFSYAGTANSESWKDWSVMLVKRADDTDLTITAAFKSPSNNEGGKHYALLLDDVKLEYVAPSSVSSTNQLDITALIKNPGFDGNSGDGWTMTTTFTNWGANAIANGNKQQWNGNFSVSQELSGLPNGVYELGVQGFYRPGGNDTSSTDRNAVLYAVGSAEVTQPLMLVSAGGKASQDDTNGYTTAFTGVEPNVYVPNSQGDAEKAFADGGYSDNSLQAIVTSGTLTIGVKKETLIGNDWTVIDNFSLKYLGTDLLLTEVINAWNTAHSNLAALDATLLPDAAEDAITEELAKERPNTEDAIVAATAALQALIDSYDGIKAAFDEYNALKAQVVDLKNTSKYTFTGDAAVSTLTSTLSTIDASAEAATDAATLTALLPSLKTAGNTFVGGIESNDGFDLTYNIENNSFETGALSPWTTNGSNDTGVKPNSNGTYTTTGVDGAYLFNTWNNGAGSKVSQTLSSLPEGYYTVTALVASDAGNTINILAGASTKGIASATEGKTKFVEGTTDKVLVSDGSLEIGTNSSTWYKSDNFRLTYYTVTAGARDAWLAAKAAAESARDDAAYTNVTGSERTDLLAEIAKAEPSTAEAYGTATTALQEKTSAFTAAKDSYDALVAMRTVGGTYTTVAWPRASEAKATALADAIAAEPTDAADAVTKTNAIVTAYRQFVESNGLAEGVAVAVDYTSTCLAGADPDVNTGWTGGIGTDWRSQEIYTKGDGAQGGRYYDGGWSTSAAVDINMTRELTLPAGQYQLQITARGSASLTAYTMSIGGQTVNLPIEGSDAAAGTFGHGWSDKFVVFESDGTTPLTLAIAATSTEYQQWISFNRLRLVKLDATLATAEDYAALNTAIATAEANLGFETGQNAPYANTEAMALLVAAKAIDQTVNNVQGDVQAATTALTGATWTANTEDVDAIYNGMFDSAVEGDWGLTAWTRTNAWGQQRTNVDNGEGAYATAYYNQPGSLQYGNQGVYTMPLAGSQVYKLTFSYRSHENNSNTGVTASVLKGEAGLAATTFPGNGSTSDWKTVEAYFTTGSAGDYVLTLANGGNTWMTNVSLVKADASALNLYDTSETLPANGYYQSMTIIRVLPGDAWCSFSLPFSLSADQLTAASADGYDLGVIKKFSSADENVITMEDATKIVAGEPYLVKPSSMLTNPVFKGVTVSNPTEAEMGTGDYTFKAHLCATDLPTNGSIAYISTTNNSIKKLTSGGIKGTRAIFKIPVPEDPSTPVKALVVNFGDGTTGIMSVENGEMSISEGAIYNLAGQRVNKAQKGIFIQNGKKVLVK